MTFPDLIKEIFYSTKERIKTPISGAFFYSFIIYNWRPIVFLVFSKTSIENKIIVINHEYCNFWAIFVPIIIATLYTLIIPKIMLQIDNDLAETKLQRISNIYDVKKHTVEQKKLLAGEEVELNDIISGNRSRQELIDKIVTLEEANIQRALADKSTIDSLNLQLAESNKIIVSQQKSRKINLEQATKDLIVDDTFIQLTQKERIILYDFILANGKKDLSKLPNDIAHKFLNFNLFVETENPEHWLISDIGLRLFNKIHRSLNTNLNK